MKENIVTRFYYSLSTILKSHLPVALVGLEYLCNLNLKIIKIMNY